MVRIGRPPGLEGINTCIRLNQSCNYIYSTKNVSLSIKTDTGTDITWAKLDELHYLSNIIKESMRLYPAASIVGRLSTQDDTLGGFHIPANTSILCGIHAVQRSEKYWPDPNTFKPERFENLSKCVISCNGSRGGRRGKGGRRKDKHLTRWFCTIRTYVCHWVEFVKIR